MPRHLNILAESTSQFTHFQRLPITRPFPTQARSHTPGIELSARRKRPHHLRSQNGAAPCNPRDSRQCSPTSQRCVEWISGTLPNMCWRIIDFHARRGPFGSRTYLQTCAIPQIAFAGCRASPAAALAGMSRIRVDES